MGLIQDDDRLLRGRHRFGKSIETLEPWAPKVGDVLEGELSPRSDWGAIDHSETIRLRTGPLVDTPLVIRGSELVRQLGKIRPQTGDLLRFERLEDVAGVTGIQIAVERAASPKRQAESRNP